MTGANLDEADLRSARGLDTVIGLATAANIDSGTPGAGGTLAEISPPLSTG